MTSCPKPVSIPYDQMVDGVLPMDVVFLSWGYDRKSLIVCNMKHDALIGYYAGLQDNLRVVPTPQ